MEVTKNKTLGVKRVVPIKGNLLQKLKLELKNNNTSARKIENDTINNNSVKSDLKVKPESATKKIVIQRVENVKIDKIHTKSNVIEISKLFPQPQEELPVENLINPEPQPSSESIKLLQAEIPPNDFNSKVPLKMIRTIRVPKVTPAPLRRLHRVNIDKSVEIPPVKVEPLPVERNVEVCSMEVLPDLLGFDKSDQEEPDIGLWRLVFTEKQEPKEEVVVKPTEIVETAQIQKVNNKRVVGTVSKDSLLKKLQKRKIFENLKEASKPPEVEEKVQLEMEKMNIVPEESPQPEPVPNFSSNLITSTPVTKVKKQIEKSTETPETSTQLPKSEEHKSWQLDIFSVIGLKRIDEIDEDLKQIPNLVTGNAIEAENVEFKLIVNHMKRLLGVKTIRETLNMKSKIDDDKNESEFNDDDDDSFNNMDDSSEDLNSDDFPDDDFSDSEDNAIEVLRDEVLIPGKSCVDNISINCGESIFDNTLINNTKSIETSKQSVSEKVNPIQSEETHNYENVIKNVKTESHSEPPVRIAKTTNSKPEESSSKHSVNLKQKPESKSQSRKGRNSVKSIAEIFPKKEKSPTKTIDIELAEKFISEINSITKENVDENPPESLECNEIPPTDNHQVIEKKQDEKPKKKAGRPRKAVTPEETTNVSKRRKKSPTPNDSDDDIVLKSIQRNSRKRLRVIESDSEKSHDEYIPKQTDITSKTETVKKSVGRPPKKTATDVRKIMAKFIDEQKKDILSRKSTDESKVPYKELVSSIILTNTSGKKGRLSLSHKSSQEQEKIELTKKLESLKFFRCGNCMKEINKSDWRQHFIEHAGICWLDKFELAMNLDDWNESLRRLINNFKQYSLGHLTCLKCGAEKKSALGHLSHIFVCGESDETLERRKIPCEFCNEKILPFSSSFHRSKCSALIAQTQTKEVIEVPEVVDLDTTEFSTTGRLKRQATKKAENSFKNIINKNNDVSEHYTVLKDDFLCLMCKDNFRLKEKCIEHIQRVHNPNSVGDFDDSGSEVELKFGESSESEDESSGDSSSDIQTDNENGLENKTLNTSKRRKRDNMSHKDNEELRNACKIVSNFTYNDTLKNFLHKCNKKFINNYLKSELLISLIPPKYSSNLNPHSVIEALSFSGISFKFSYKPTEFYSSKFNQIRCEETSQLKIDEFSRKGNETTFFCGGSISSIDWAPVEDNCDLDFLAVACNRRNETLSYGIEKTTISMIQIYQFKYIKHSTNECQLSYVFNVFEGPIWSIKFHPSQSTLSNRIGLLAVTTANQNILIFSLPFLHDNHSLSLQLEPCLVCKLDSSDIFFKDQYLYQATTLNWMVDQNQDTLLGAGYVSGAFAIWKVYENSKHPLYPIHYIHAHNEAITSLDFKILSNDSYYIVTTSLDRKIITHLVQDYCITETSNFLTMTRITTAQWMIHWPGFIYGTDESFSASKVDFRQPLEFGPKVNLVSQPLNSTFSVKSLSINNWENVILMATDTGDVISCQPDQLFATRYSDRWQDFKCDIVSFTDFQTIASESGEEIGLVFCDLKKQVTSQPKTFRSPPADHIIDLMINQVCFNRNEKRNRIYALGYETGFVRIKYLKNLK